MADEKEPKSEKKEDKPKASYASEWHVLGEIAVVVIIALIISNSLSSFWGWIGGRPGEDKTGVQNQGAELIGIDNDGDGYIDEYVYDTSTGDISSESAWRRFAADPSWQNLMRIIRTTPGLSWLVPAYSTLVFILYAISAALIAWIVYLRKKINDIEEKEKVMLDSPPAEEVPINDSGALRWERIKERVTVNNPEGWKLAILEADIILDEILDINGYRGSTVGEKLKAVEPSDMDTLNEAWEAHKVRNAIAHEGEAFELSQDEAQRTIKMYEKVFKEYEYI